MASNNRKEEIRVEWSTNYTQAIQQIEQVKKSVGDNATELENLNRVQQKLEDNFKGFEKTLDYVSKQTGENEYANQKLTEAIEKLEKQIVEVDNKLNSLSQSLQDVAKSNEKVADSVDEVTKANDKASKTVDKAKDSNKDLSDSNKDLSHTTKDLTESTRSSNSEMVEASGIWELLDEQTHGLASRFRDFIGANGGFKQAITGNADAFSAMSTKAKVATVAINTAKLALRALAVASVIGALVIGLQYVVEHWDEINKSIRGAIDNTYKLNQLELEKIKLQKEQLELVNNQTEQLKRQGYSELEILKIKQKQIIDNIKLVVRENQLKRESELGSLTFLEAFEEGWNKIYSVIYGTVGVLVAGIEASYQAIKNIVTLGQSEFKMPVTESLFETSNDLWNSASNKKKQRGAEAYEQSDEYKEFQKTLAGMRENYASISNQIDNFGKKNSSAVKKLTDDSAKLLADHQAKVETARKLLDAYQHDIDSLNADNVFLKKQADWSKREYDSNEKLKDSLKTLGEAYAETDAKYIAGKQKIDEYHKTVVDKIESEKKAYKESTLLLFELQSQLDTGNLSLEEQQKQINKFLDTITDADVKDEWSKLLGIDKLTEAISFMEAYKDEMKEFTIDDSASFNDNSNKLQAIKDFNLSLLDEERATALARADELVLSEENRLKIIEKFKKQQNEIESNYNEASRELNQKRATQISDYADAASSGLNSLGSLMSENFETQKSFSLAGALIDTYSSINKTLSAFSGMPIPGYAIAQAIATGIAGFAQVISIMKTNPESASSATAPSMASLDSARTQPNVSFQQSGESQLAQTINNQNQDPIRAYVVSKDITSAQEKDNIKKNNSSL